MVNKVKGLLASMVGHNVSLFKTNGEIEYKFYENFYTDKEIINNQEYIVFGDDNDALGNEYKLSEDMIANVEDYEDDDFTIIMKSGVCLQIQVQ